MKKNILRLTLLALLAITLFGEHVQAQDDEEEVPESPGDEGDEIVDDDYEDPVIDIDDMWLMPFSVDDPNVIEKTNSAGEPCEDCKWPGAAPSYDGDQPWDIDQSDYYAEDWFEGIPDLVNKTETEFWFRMSNAFLTGMKRGLYDDNKLKLNDECFGPYYMKKLNEYAYLFWGNPFGNFFENMFPEMALTYEFYYMIWNKCDVDDSINEVMMYCWYKGCWPEKMFWDAWNNGKLLYIARALNDAAIVLWEAFMPGAEENQPEREHETMVQHYVDVSMESGKTVAEVIRDVTGFEMLDDDLKN